MAPKPFPWRKLTPSQIDLMKRLAKADSALLYDSLSHRDLVALNELERLKLAAIRPTGGSKLESVLTEAGRELRDNAYRTERVMVRVTEPQIALLRHLDDDVPHEQSLVHPVNELVGMMLDVCRRMSLRGWVEWYDDKDGTRWARLSASGREVLAALDAMDEATEQMAEARRLATCTEL